MPVPVDRAVYGVGLRPLASFDRGFESHMGYGCLPVVCCQVEVSATSWSLVQRSPNNNNNNNNNNNESSSYHYTVYYYYYYYYCCYYYYYYYYYYYCRSQCPHGLRRRSTAARLLQFESHRGHGCFSVVCVVCCQVEVSATSWSLVQRSTTDCGASLCVITKSCGQGGYSPHWAAEPEIIVIVNESNACCCLACYSLHCYEPWIAFSKTNRAKTVWYLQYNIKIKLNSKVRQVNKWRILAAGGGMNLPMWYQSSFLAGVCNHIMKSDFSYSLTPHSTVLLEKLTSLRS
jgi:hypothetical protein